ncbi:MAG: hypothetical protein PHU32_05735 [Candidatus ainarchaeum sp.]|nr:hypothetical protein [Candidatus ainarchaeum sp.]
MKKIFLVCFIILFLNNLIFADNLGEPPGLPDNIYGDVYINGDPVEVDTTIYAKVGTNSSTEYIITESGKFGSIDDQNKRLLVFGTILDVGEEINFYVFDESQNEIFAQTIPETIYYDGGENKSIILNFTIEDITDDTNTTEDTNTTIDDDTNIIGDDDTNVTEDDDDSEVITPPSIGGSAGGSGGGGFTNIITPENNTDNNYIDQNQIIEESNNNETIDKNITTNDDLEKKDTNISKNYLNETKYTVLSDPIKKTYNSIKNNFNSQSILNKSLVIIFLLLFLLGITFVIKKNKKQ